MYETRPILRVKKIADNSKIPTRAHPTDAGLDLYVRYVEIVDNDGEKLFKVHFGVAVEIPYEYFGILIPRSSTSKKLGLHQINGMGIIDSDYRGELIAYYKSTKENPVYEMKQARDLFNKSIAQLVITPCLLPEVVEKQELSSTERDSGGFGSTTKS